MIHIPARAGMSFGSNRSLTRVSTASPYAVYSALTGSALFGRIRMIPCDSTHFSSPVFDELFGLA